MIRIIFETLSIVKKRIEIYYSSTLCKLLAIQKFEIKLFYKKLKLSF